MTASDRNEIARSTRGPCKKGKLLELLDLARDREFDGCEVDVNDDDTEASILEL